ncbi:MAG: hypothetical protein R2681_12725 [Pyrinomonadaceae bacterium]
MKLRIFAVLALFAFVFGAVGALTARTTAARTNNLAGLLPQSDGVITLDSDRLFNSVLPQILSANPEMLGKITAKLDDIETKTGIDLRKFEEVAIGLNMNEASEEGVDYEPVLLARGNVESQALVSVARLASNGEYHTEKIGDRTIYIFSPKKILDDVQTDKKDEDKNLFEQMIDKAFKGLSKEIALTAYDENTVAIGSVSRVKDLLAKTPRVSSDVLALLDRNPNAVANLGAMLPTGIAQFIELGDNELGDVLASIRELQGALDVDELNAVLSLMAKTEDGAQAETLHTTLMGFQILGKTLLGSSQNADKQVYARMVENASITRDEKSVMLDLSVPKSDIDIIVGQK